MGRSGKAICEVKFAIKYLADRNTIYQKKEFNKHKFTLKSSDSLVIDPYVYFGGSSLRFDTSKVDKKLKTDFSGIDKYKLNNGLKGMDHYQIVGIDQSHFYLVGVKQPDIYIQLCTLNDNNSVDCKETYHDTYVNSSVTTIHGARRKNKEKMVIFGYDYDQVFSSLDLDKPSNSWTMTQTGYQYSQILVG